MCNIVILGKWGKNKYSCIRRQRQIRHKSQTLVVSLNGDCWGGLVGHMMDGSTLHTYWLQCTTWTRDRFPITDSYEEPHFANIKYPHSHDDIRHNLILSAPPCPLPPSVAFLTITGKNLFYCISNDNWQLMSNIGKPWHQCEAEPFNFYR